MLQKEQDSEIQQLEHQLEEERFAHEEKIRAIKTQFLKEKRLLEEESEAKIREMTAHANKVGHMNAISSCESIKALCTVKC